MLPVPIYKYTYRYGNIRKWRRMWQITPSEAISTSKRDQSTVLMSTCVNVISFSFRLSKIILFGHTELRFFERIGRTELRIITAKICICICNYHTYVHFKNSLFLSPLPLSLRTLRLETGINSTRSLITSGYNILKTLSLSHSLLFSLPI